MPKLDGTHLPQRIQQRLDELKAGNEVAAREIRALLNENQLKDMDAAWVEQQELRKKKRARTKEEEKELGWKTKREIHIEAYEMALEDAENDELNAYKKRLKDAEVRAAKIYLDEYFAAKNDGKEPHQAASVANNALKRAHLERADSKRIEERDKEVWAMEDELRKTIRANLPEHEREQLEAIERQKKATIGRGKRGG